MIQPIHADSAEPQREVLAILLITSFGQAPTKQLIDVALAAN